MSKLTDIQNELKAPKNQYNKFGGYAYRSCEDILEAVKPLCKKHGCEVLMSDDIVLVGDRFYVKATCSFFDGERTTTTTAFAREELAKKGMDAAQVTGAASSYARKYALNAMFLIDDNKDADTNEQAIQASTAPKTAKPVQQKKAVEAVLTAEQMEQVKFEANVCKNAQELVEVYKAHAAKGEWNNELAQYFKELKAQNGWS